MWDNWSKKRNGLPVYDDWLDDYNEVLDSNKNSEILDLGCGIGADTLCLIERGFNVLSCDFSNEALESIRKNIPNSKTRYLDMQEIFSLTTKQFGRVLGNIKRRHKYDYWIWIEKDRDNKSKMYINKECVEWLKKFTSTKKYIT